MNYASPTHDRPRPRTLSSDLDALRSRVASAVEAQPIAAVATAAGIGFVLGSRLARPAMALLIDTAARVAATWLGETIRETSFAHREPDDRRAANTTNDPDTGGTRS
jgi:hypothetical protein